MFKEINPTELENMNAFRAVGKEWFLITAEADGIRNAMTASPPSATISEILPPRLHETPDL